MINKVYFIYLNLDPIQILISNHFILLVASTISAIDFSGFML
jgi:hypothetical protein